MEKKLRKDQRVLRWGGSKGDPIHFFRGSDQKSDFSGVTDVSRKFFSVYEIKSIKMCISWWKNYLAN